MQGRLNRKGTFRGRQENSRKREEEEEVLTKDERLLASLNVFDKHLNYSGKMLGVYLSHTYVNPTFGAGSFATNPIHPTNGTKMSPPLTRC